MFCGSCGAAVTPGGKFCGKCGAAVQPPAQDVAPVNDAAADATIVRAAQPAAPVAATPPAYTPPPVAAPPAYTPPVAAPAAPVAPPIPDAPAAYAPPAQPGVAAAPAAYGAAPYQGVNVKFNLAAWSIFDYAALGAGLLFFIFSFISPFARAKSKQFCELGSCYGGDSLGANAWHSFAVVGVLLVLAAVLLVALKALDVGLPTSGHWSWVPAGVAALGLLLLIIRVFTVGPGYFVSGASCDGDCGGVSFGPGWSGWLLLVLGLVIVAALATPLIQASMANRPPRPQQFAQPGFPPPPYQPPAQQPPAYQPPPTQAPTDFPPPPA